MSHTATRRTDITRLPVNGAAPLHEVARIVNALIDGKSENHGVVTLLNGTTETVISSPLLNPHSVINLVPTSAAAAAVAWWQKDATIKRTVVVGHADPLADLEFFWVAVG